MLYFLLTESTLHINYVLVSALIFILIYEAINGFHDTSNAVATVIYTRALRSNSAVIISGIFNFVGVMVSGLGIAYTIVHLLSNNLLVGDNSSDGLIMIFSILSSAILWNLGTWYLGLPSSSSHILIGAVVGIGIANTIVKKIPITQALNISKLTEVFFSLIVSPIIGLILSGILIFILCYYWNDKKKSNKIHLTPEELEEKTGKYTPPFWIRVVLILSSMGISFSHGSNDGQKGIGLIILMLITLSPTKFALNMQASNYDIIKTKNAINCFHKYYIQHRDNFINSIDQKKGMVSLKNTNLRNLSDLSTSYNVLVSHDKKDNLHFCYEEQSNVKRNYTQQQHYTSYNVNPFYYNELYILSTISNIRSLLNNLDNYRNLSEGERLHVRYLLIYIANAIDRILRSPNLSIKDRYTLLQLNKDILHTVEYAPNWVIISVALSLSLGTMIGWNRITKTIGEKIGKKRMTYAQGLSAQVTAAISIGIASYTGMPVSTTHVLSSAVAGSMIINGGIQKQTVKKIFLTWVLTLPIGILLASGLYLMMFFLT